MLVRNRCQKVEYRLNSTMMMLIQHYEKYVKEEMNYPSNGRLISRLELMRRLKQFNHLVK